MQRGDFHVKPKSMAVQIVMASPRGRIRGKDGRANDVHQLSLRALLSVQYEPESARRFGRILCKLFGAGPDRLLLWRLDSEELPLLTADGSEFRVNGLPLPPLLFACGLNGHVTMSAPEALLPPVKVLKHQHDRVTAKGLILNRFRLGMNLCGTCTR
jgi:hypothetical protein